VSKIDELGEIELSDNIALKKYLDTLRKLCYNLYIEVSWAADVLQQRLANIKGVRNNIRARLIAAALRAVAESFKVAGAGTVKTWTMFETKFSQELELAASASKTPKEEFKIK
jgi:hypothetical protein